MAGENDKLWVTVVPYLAINWLSHSLMHVLILFLHTHLHRPSSVCRLHMLKVNYSKSMMMLINLSPEKLDSLKTSLLSLEERNHSHNLGYH